MLKLYIDPGTGSIILQAIIGFFSVLALYFFTIRKKIADFFMSKKKKKDDDD
jgi:hypothetical protein